MRTEGGCAVRMAVVVVMVIPFTWICAMSFAGGTRYDSPLRLCQDIKMRVRMPDRLPYVSTIDSSRLGLPTTSDFLTSLYVL